MRRSVIAMLLVVVVLFSVYYASAEDLSEMTVDDLKDLRLQINKELSSRNVLDEIREGSTIADLFPDPVLARYIRDEVGAFSVDEVVTQEKLDSVGTVGFTNKDSGIKSIEGIGHLHGMWQLVLDDQDQLTVIPEEIENCVSLKRFVLCCKNITSIPDSICNLTLLKDLILSRTPISELPADIGNLTNLKELNISYTKITNLPESIYTLELDKFRREGLDL